MGTLTISQKRGLFEDRFSAYAANLSRSKHLALKMVAEYKKGLDDARDYLSKRDSGQSVEGLLARYKSSMPKELEINDLWIQRFTDAYSHGLDDGRFYVYWEAPQQ